MAEKFNAKKRKEFLEILKKGGTIVQACKAVGVSFPTVKKYREKNPKFNEKVQAYLDTQVEMVASALYKKALEGNVTAQIFFLVNRSQGRSWASEKWSNVNLIKADITSKKSETLNIINSLSEEDKKLLKEFGDRIMRLLRDRRGRPPKKLKEEQNPKLLN